MTICKNDFFTNPDKVLPLFDKQEYVQSASFPGKRTHNLLEANDIETKNFALFFVQKICDEIFPGIHKMMIDVRFHINEEYSVTKANEGWIHKDDADLAGVVYLTKDEESLETGTSLFVKNTTEDFKVDDFKSRQDFNLSGIASNEYLNDLENNHRTFTETIKVGNLYNRLIAYDAKLFHRPNRYNLNCHKARQSIVFFIRGFERKFVPVVDLNSSWEDA
jgi:hypothetical protein